MGCKTSIRISMTSTVVLRSSADDLQLEPEKFYPGPCLLFRKRTDEWSKSDEREIGNLFYQQR